MSIHRDKVDENQSNPRDCSDSNHYSTSATLDNNSVSPWPVIRDYLLSRLESLSRDHKTSHSASIASSPSYISSSSASIPVTNTNSSSGGDIVEDLEVPHYLHQSVRQMRQILRKCIQERASSSVLVLGPSNTLTNNQIINSSIHSILSQINQTHTQSEVSVSVDGSDSTQNTQGNTSARAKDFIQLHIARINGILYDNDESALIAITNQFQKRSIHEKGFFDSMTDLSAFLQVEIIIIHLLQEDCKIDR